MSDRSINENPTETTQPMNIGQSVKVRYVDNFTYTLDVKVIALPIRDEFVGRIEKVFSDRGEITGGKILALVGRETSFKNGDVVAD